MIRKWDKGEKFQMQFEDGKFYKGTVLGCVDDVVVEDHRTNATHGSAASLTNPDLGIPWEALQVSRRRRHCAAMVMPFGLGQWECLERFDLECSIDAAGRVVTCV